ncbi:indole-3-glycerol phosphate synthase [Halobacteriales archaeon QS_3_64_16]|nr:MAG: indole-3-glycerol phosphate synthase [Halobacteriales archaeon QS_3_64_16]
MNVKDDLNPAVASILEAARDRPGGEEVLSVAARSLPAALADAAADGRVPIIAEVKPTSPTTEGHRASDPVELAEEMVAGGAAALSVLTEPAHFGGSTADLRRVREAVSVPVLRKDFLLRESHLDAVPADLVLLIARFVDDLDGLVQAARERGMEPLIEAHTTAELERAIDAGAEVVGINNRDLARLEVDLDTFERVAREAPEDLTLIAESGISSTEDAARMRQAGADGLLVGSAIMNGDVRVNTERLTRPEEDLEV